MKNLPLKLLRYSVNPSKPQKRGDSACLREGFLSLSKDTMNAATLIRKTFKLGGLLTIPEVRSIIIMLGCVEVCRQMCC